MATPEGKVKRDLDKMFNAEGVEFHSPQAGPYGGTGVEDRIAIVCGLYLGVEAKADASKKMTAKQELRKKKVLAAGGTHFLVYDKETIEQVRQWIVNVRRTSNSRQEDTSSGVGEPRSNLRDYPVCTCSPLEAHSEPCPAHSGNVHYTEKPRGPSSTAPAVLLQLAGEVQAVHPPKGNGCLPNYP